MIEQNKISNNSMVVMALASEYCRALEMVQTTGAKNFVEKMVKMLPRIYMAVTDIPRADDAEQDDYVFGAHHLEEHTYDTIRQRIAALLGEHDTYLETFHEDMKYSDTPIGASISEGLADIFQVLYNFVEDVRNADVSTTLTHLALLRADFSEYWSQTLCNVMRPLNELAQSVLANDENYNDSDEIDFV